MMRIRRSASFGQKCRRLPPEYGYRIQKRRKQKITRKPAMRQWKPENCAAAG